MFKFFMPAISLMDKLAYSKKIFLIGVLSSLAMGVLITNLYVELDRTVNHSRQALKGIQRVESVIRLIQLVQRYRDFSMMLHSDEILLLPSYREKTAEIETELYAILESIDPAMSLKTGDEDQLNDLGNLSGLWQSIKSNTQVSAYKNFIEYAHFIRQLHVLVKVIGEHYQLLINDKVYSHYTINILLNIIPNMTENLAKVRALGGSVLADRALSYTQQVKLIGLQSNLEQNFNNLAFDMIKVKQYAPEFFNQFSQIYSFIQQDKQIVVDLIHDDILNRQFQIPYQQFYTQVTREIDYIYLFIYQDFIPTIKNIIRQDLNKSLWGFWAIIGISSVLMAATFYFLIGLSLAVLRSINHVNRVLQDYVGGDLVPRVHLSTQDEMRSISESINHMADRFVKVTLFNQQEKERFEVLFEKSGHGLSLLDPELGFIDCNEAAVKMMGYDSKQELLSKEFHDLSPKYQADGQLSVEKIIVTTEQCLQQGRLQFEWMNQKKDGSILLVNVLLIRLDYQGKQFIHVTARDISHQKQLEIDNERIKNEAIKANQAKSAFLANMSHELRTPMHGILSFSKFGIKKYNKVDREKLYDYFSHIHTSGGRLLVLLNDLLDLSKLEAGKEVLYKKQNDLKSIFKQCCLEQKQRIEDLNLSIECHYEDVPFTGNFDGNKITQVITNILSNAIKFSPEGSIIRVTIVKMDNNELCFSMEDRGLGIPTNELSEVFNAFIQSSKTNTGAGGTGLGLAISQKIIEVHGGRIWAENNPNGGAIFRFTLP